MSDWVDTRNRDEAEDAGESPKDASERPSSSEPVQPVVQAPRVQTPRPQVPKVQVKRPINPVPGGPVRPTSPAAQGPATVAPAHPRPLPPRPSAPRSQPPPRPQPPARPERPSEPPPTVAPVPSTSHVDEADEVPVQPLVAPVQPRTNAIKMRDDETYDLIGTSGDVDLMVEVRDLHMVFASGFKSPVHALRGVTLSVERGSIMGLLGPNGSGKTTTLACMLGLLNPQHGSIRVDGKEVSYGGRDGRQRSYGAMLEDTRLPPFLSVSESLKLVCSMCRLEGHDARLEFDRVIHETETEGLLERTINELSKGQARRVGLAAAMIGDPPLLLLDEPSSGLDVAARVEFDEILRKLRNGKRTVIIASHFLGDVQNTCTHVGVMQKGRMMVAGSTELLLDLTEETSEDGVRSNIFVEERFLPQLAKRGIACATCHYAGLVQVLTDKPDHMIIPVMVEAGVVPRRMEPRVNLVSVYMELINEEHGEIRE